MLGEFGYLWPFLRGAYHCLLGTSATVSHSCPLKNCHKKELALMGEAGPGRRTACRVYGSGMEK
jgi:hypothetical protein